jgi:hypothetical protein
VVGINLVSMQEMQKITLLILMHMEKHGDVAKVGRGSPCPLCISKVINKFSYILIDDLLVILHPNRDVDHRIKVHP